MSLKCLILKIGLEEFPGDLVVRTLCFHCQGPVFVRSLVEELRSHKLHSTANK